MWLNYVKVDLGRNALVTECLLLTCSLEPPGGSVPEIVPSIYPNKDGWPMLPPLDMLRLSMAEEKLLLCWYFTLTSCR